jgi:hypothetical protein
MNSIPGFRAIQPPEYRTVTMQTLADVVGHQLLDRPPLLQGPLFHLLDQVIREIKRGLHRSPAWETSLLACWAVMFERLCCKPFHAAGLIGRVTGKAHG